MKGNVKNIMKIGKYLLVAIFGLTVLVLAGCGNNQSSSSTPPAAPAAPSTNAAPGH